MTGHGEKLSRNQEKAIAALISHPSIPKAAKAIKIGERTLFRWMKLPEFKAAYLKARQEVVRHATVTIQNAMYEAVETLREVMKNKNARASSRVSAARAIIDTAFKAVELEDLETRISALEERIK